VRKSKYKDMSKESKSLVFVSSFEEADDADRRYFWSLGYEERLEIMETLRVRNYGESASNGFSRVLEIIERP
jgi:hypothetical protein